MTWTRSDATSPLWSACSTSGSACASRTTRCLSAGSKKTTPPGRSRASAVPGPPEDGLVTAEPVSNVIELREAMQRRFPGATEYLADRNLSVAVNGEMPLHGEKTVPVKSGDRVTLMTTIAGG